MATRTREASTNIDLKLLIDKSRNRVLFAEAEKDFVDFLFGLLQLPLGSILGLLVERRMIGAWSMSKVYESIQNLDPNYLQPNQTKMSLLDPQIPSSKTKQISIPEQFSFLMQDSMHFQTTPSLSTSSSAFGSGLFGSSTSNHSPLSFGYPSASILNVHSKESFQVDGYVKGMMKYMVMDDLTVKPMSTLSSITILNTFQVKDLGCLEEKIVEIDTKKALKLVKAAFGSTTVLTDVFLTDKLFD